MYHNFTPEALEVAEELEAAGFEIRISSRAKELGRRVDWFQFRKYGRIGYYSADFLADAHWSMPIKPSRAHGSAMFVIDAEDAETATESAEIIVREKNYNPVVGTHANFVGRFDRDYYVTA